MINGSRTFLKFLGVLTSDQYNAATLLLHTHGTCFASLAMIIRNREQSGPNGVSTRNRQGATQERDRQESAVGRGGLMAGTDAFQPSFVSSNPLTLRFAMSLSSTQGRAEATSQAWRGFKTHRLPAVPSWIETLGRLGHAAIAVVYLIIGVLAFQLAIGTGGEISGTRDAIREIGQQPYGKTLLGLMAIGLLGYTAWRWVQAARDTEGAGKDAKGIVKRIGYATSGLAYLLLGCYAGSLALGWASTSDSSSSQSGPSFLLDSTWGRVLLGAAGLITIGTACYFGYKAYRAKFMTKYRLSKMSEKARVLALHAGRIGLSTRGIAFAIVGGFIVMSAVRGTSGGDIAGLSDALAAIAAQSYGKTLLGITGFGLICYAVHMALMSWYRRFNVQ